MGSELTSVPPCCKAELASVRVATRCLQGSVPSRKVLLSLHSVVILYLAALFPLSSPGLGHLHDIEYHGLGATTHHLAVAVRNMAVTLNFCT